MQQMQLMREYGVRLVDRQVLVVAMYSMGIIGIKESL